MGLGPLLLFLTQYAKGYAMSPSLLPSNVFYGQLNKRFDKRCRQLFLMGYRKRQLTKDIAVMSKTKLGKCHDIANGTILNACPRVWREIVLAGIVR
jgi:hypothetical protein